MSMGDSVIANCPKCDSVDVLICTSCGKCGVCGRHPYCHMND